jgi:hypothetical protein
VRAGEDVFPAPGKCSVWGCARGGGGSWPGPEAGTGRACPLTSAAGPGAAAGREEGKPLPANDPGRHSRNGAGGRFRARQCDSNSYADIRDFESESPPAIVWATDGYKLP